MPTLNRAGSWPGDVLQSEFVARRGITQDRLADALGVSRYSVNQIVNNRRNITAEMALRLARVFSTTPEFWLDLQRDVDLQRAQQKKGGEIAKLTPLLGTTEGPPLSSIEALFGDASR